MDSRFSFLFDGAEDIFCIVEQSGVLAYANNAFKNIFGYDESEISNINIGEISHPADRQRREELYATLPERKRVSGYESRLKAKGGRYYTVVWTVFYNEADQLMYARGTPLTPRLKHPEENNVSDNIQHIVQSFNEAFIVLDEQWHITAFNPALQAITGLTYNELNNTDFRVLKSLGITDEVMSEFETAFYSNVSSQLQYYNANFNRWLRVNFYPYNNEVNIFIRDITSIKISQLVLALEKSILEVNASSQYTLSQTIDQLLEGVEAIYPDMICSVLEVDEEQETVTHLSAPRLPDAVCESINGLPIGPKAGSCGTAAYHRTQVIVSDIETDPLWEDFKHLVLPYGLKACWSTPIISSHGAQVLATFAVYYTQVREPKDEELRMIERTANILRVLIESKRNQDHVKDQNERLQEIAAISSHDLRRPVATILGLVNLFDRKNLDNPLNKEIITHLDVRW
jgi:PAS domain S-box-containing protein